MKNKKKKLVIIIPATVVFIAAWLAFCGYEWSWGPFVSLHNFKTASLVGNAETYSIDNAEVVSDSPLKGKKIVFLGSSVTYGASSLGVSFADYVGRENECQAVKEAVSGTTLVDEGTDSYISRLENLNEEDVDIFVCQLSTNDATQKKEPGEVSKSTDIADFDTDTIAGAIEYIVAYAKNKWSCPVVFFTNPRYESEAYQDMVDLLYQVKDKWNIEIIDLWGDDDFNNITAEQRKLYMADKIHPTMAGYLEWWTPVFNNKLAEVISNESN